MRLQGTRPLAWLLASWLAIAVHTVGAAPQHDQVLSRIAPGPRALLNELATLAPDELARLDGVADSAAIERDTRELLALDSLNVATRSVGPDGRPGIHRYLERRLESLAPYGVERLGSIRGQVPVPVPLNLLADRARREPAAEIIIGAHRFHLHPLWANGPQPSLAPRGGLTGPLLDAGDANWPALAGLPLPGSIALMDFRGARNWERLFSLGVQAVIVIEDDFVSRDAAERLFAHTPVPCPRYYVDRETGETLRRLARGESGPSSPAATVNGGTIYENRPWETLFAYLPPTAPTTHTVMHGELLQRIATDFGLTGPQLAQSAGLDDAEDELSAGRVLAIPGGNVTYTVRPNDLWVRLASRYGLALESLRAANPTLPDALPSGSVLTIPNVADTLTVIVPIDAMSVAPDAPHGALRAANLAASLRFLEHLVRDSAAPRRKGLLLVFQDADTLGGVSSRTFARYALIAQNRFEPLERFEAHGNLRQLEQALAWFAAKDEAAAAAHLRALAPVERAWLGGEWLAARFEERRVALAEARIAAVTDRQSLAGDAPAAVREAADAALASAERALRALVTLRDRTIGPGRTVSAEQLTTLRAALLDPAQENGPGDIGLDWSALRERLAREHAEEAFRRSSDENNRRVAREVLRRLHPDRVLGDTVPRLAWFLDLTDGSATLALNHARAIDFRSAFPAAANPGNARSFEHRFSQIVAAASVRAGWRQEWAFAADADRREFPQLPVITPPVYPDFWTSADVALFSLGTLNDRLPRLDTPHDTADRFDFPSFATVARSAFVLLQAGLEHPADSLAPSRLPRPRFGQLSGRALQFNIRSGIDAKDPVDGASVYYPAVRQIEVVGSFNTSTHRGYRRGVMQLTSEDGVYRLPLENTAFRALNHIYAYRIDRDAAVFTKVINHGQVGTRGQDLTFTLQSDREVEKNLVMADVYPLAIFADSDPHAYRAIGGARDRKIRQSIRLIDSVLRGEPRHFALENPALHFNERDLATTLFYAPVGRSVRAVVQEKTQFKLLLTGPLLDGLGSGYQIGPHSWSAGPSATPGAERNLSLPLTALLTARDFLAMAEHRLALFREHGITSRPIEQAVARASAKIAEAESAVAARDWVGATGAAREAWGILIKTYPRLLALGREGVFSVIVLMALMLPACIFLERLIVGGRGIVRHLVGVTSLFVLGTLFLNAFHPAFRIAVSPFIVVIAFTMILMSAIVLVICYQRFEVLLRRARQQEGEVSAEAIGALGALKTALSLGVANLRKRPSRTALTAFTIAVLTFSIVSFVSVSARDALRFRAHAVDADIEGRQVEPEMPAYEGVLFRNYNWIHYGTQDIATLRSEFSGAQEVTTRGFYLETEGGAGADREGVNQIVVTREARSVIQTGVMTFEPNEPRFSGLDRAVSANTWFVEDDRFHVIVPDTVAVELGIAPADLVDATGRRRPDAQLPVVRFLNLDWRVIGLLDSGRADRVRDVNGKSLALVDHQRSAMTSHATGENLLTESPSMHFGWARLLIVPQRAAEDINARPRAVAVKFGDGADAGRFLDDLALRLNHAFFIHAGDRLGVLAPTERRSITGVAKIVVPVLLCVLIVLNTMMGTVEERKGEVGMLGAIGLSPRHISFLLLSESAVFSVLGIVFGLFTGLGLANLIPWLEGHGVDAFTGLSFNFTSLPSLLLALGTGAVVLLATLLPARRAAALAAPSGMTAWALPSPGADGRISFELPFTLTRENSAGMIAFFRQFLQNHTEPTSADFNCRHVHVTRSNDAGTTITCTLWLAPYDLDVAQDFELRVSPSQTAGVDHVALVLERKSGTEEAWLRTTYAFLNLVRQQFLLWRNLAPEMRARYIEAGRDPAATTGL